MKIKTSELEGVALDYAVARCEGIHLNRHYTSVGNYLVYCGNLWQPSTDWSQAGPIIEREGMAINVTGTGWEAEIFDPVTTTWPIGNGSTHLIAAMRCYVASRCRRAAR